MAPHNRDRLVFSRISGKMADIFVVMNADFNIRLTFLPIAIWSLPDL
jgi:hypothetical protein